MTKKWEPDHVFTSEVVNRNYNREQFTNWLAYEAVWPAEAWDLREYLLSDGASENSWTYADDLVYITGSNLTQTAHCIVKTLVGDEIRIVLPMRAVKQLPDSLYQRIQKEADDSARNYYTFILYGTLCANKGTVPVAIQSEAALVSPHINPFAGHIERDCVEAYGNSFLGETDPDSPIAEAARRMLSMRLAGIRCFEIADTPNWYYLAEDLARMLLFTELKEVKSEHLKLPHPLVIFCVPKGLLQIRQPPSPVRSNIRIIALFKGVVRNPDDPFDIRECIYLHIVREAEYAADEGRCFLTRQMIPFNSGVDDLLAMVQEQVDETYADTQAEGWIDGRHVDGAELFMQTLSLAFNALLYLTSHNADVKKRQPRKPKRKKGTSRRQSKRSLTPDEEWLVGTTVKMSPELREAMANVRKSGEKLNSVKYAQIVAGHPKQQAYGPRHSLRRPIWVEPYPRNKDMGRIIGHTYHPPEKPKARKSA